MLRWWWELMPLFVVRWLALRHCEQLWAAATLRVVMPRPDVLVRVPMPQIGCEETGEDTKDPRGCWNVRCQLGKRCCRREKPNG